MKDYPIGIFIPHFRIRELEDPMKNSIKRLMIIFSNLNPISNRYTVLCNDGTTRTVFKNVEDAIPIPQDIELSGRVSTSVNDLMGDSIGLNAQWRDRVHPLISSLNDQIVDYYSHIRSAYSVYQTNPCEYDEFYMRQTEQIRQEGNTILRYRDTIRGLILLSKDNPSNPEIIRIFREICYNMVGIVNPICINREFRDAQKIADEWIWEGGPDAS
jgi:hypothetical protein